MNQRAIGKNMETMRFGVGVFVFVFNRDISKILLIKRNGEKRKKFGFTWGTPGGKLEFNEHSLDGAIRETREEIGIKLDKNSVKLLELHELPNFRKDVHGFAFKYAAILDENEKITLNKESDGYCWFDISNLPEDRIKDDDIAALAQLAKQRLI
jgi:ADP-ribose pyrophosphatase YjhB (NUDIX family)